MSRLLVRPQPGPGGASAVEVTPQSAGWTHVGFRSLVLAGGEVFELCTAGRETCIVILAGTADISVGGQSLGPIGTRASVFADAPPGAVYVPDATPYRIAALGRVELALCTAPATGGGAARVIAPADMPVEVRGSGSNTRHVRNILPETAPAQSLLVVEVITPGGNWSSYPPHKHDQTTAGEETRLEETYYFRVNPPQGFAVQRVYTQSRSIDETICVHDGDVVMVPEGYHPVGATHGYDLYYLNVMAGPERKWIFRNDPDHAWIVARPSPGQPGAD
jgi:5-deoxy-glucuronate isomerase